MMRFEDMSTGYSGVPTVAGVNGCLEAGRLTGIIGPNGSGKTTLLKAAAGLLPVLSGTVALEGRALGEYDAKALARRVSYLPQTRAVPGILVKSLVAHGRYPHLGFGRTLATQDRAQIDAAMTQAGVMDLRNRPVPELSGGERQRAYIAMMLAQDTPLMLLDEPATSLDMHSQFALMDMLAALAASGKTIAIALHELPLAMTYCDTLWVMQQGRVLRQDTPQALYEDGTLARTFGIGVRRVDGHYLFEKEKNT